ncbi:MAG: phage tail assembly chaperone [Rhizomicrobium sp.]
MCTGGGLLCRGGGGATPARAPLARADLEQMMKAYPDEK